MLIAPPGKRSRIPRKNVVINVEGKLISPSNQLKYLGVTFQPHGQFTKHAKNMEVRGKGLVGASRRLLSNKSLNHKTKVSIYKMFIRSSATYACAIWANPKNITGIQKMERWAFRYALNTFRNPDTRHWISNEILYRAMEMETVAEFIEKCKEKHTRRVEAHPNIYIKKFVAESRQ